MKPPQQQPQTVKAIDSTLKSHGASVSVTTIPASNSNANQWTTAEKKVFALGLRQYGKNFNKIAEKLQRRTAEQCRNYFQNYKQKLNLMVYVREYEQRTGNTS